MANVRRVVRAGDGLRVLLDDGQNIYCRPTPTGLWMPARGAVVPDPDPVDPVDPPEPGGTSPFKWPMNPLALNHRNGSINGAYGSSFGGPNTIRSSHNGNDFSWPPYFTDGMPIRSIADGHVVRAYWEPGGGGWFVEVAHGSRWRSGYAHGGTASNSSFRVANGQSVTQGQHLMDAGTTGQSTGPHLHFMMVDMNKTGSFWSSHVDPEVAMAELNPNDEYV